MVISYLGRGIAHERAGVPCQDAIGGCRTDGGEIILAVSDGAGSARWASEAARATVQAVLDFFVRTPLAEFMALPQQQAREQLLEACRSVLHGLQQLLAEPDLRQFSATLLFAVIGREKLLVGHLGDGIAVVLDSMGRLLLYSGPEQGWRGGDSTWFTISANARQRLRLYLLDRGNTSADVLVLTSDGPFEMFRGRGEGDPAATVRELWGYIRTAGLATDDDLGDVLNQMAEITDERMDDWSVAVWCAAKGPDVIPAGRAPHSMLEEEEAKYRM